MLANLTEHHDRYLEVDGADQDIRPWLWIVILFLGQVSRSLSEQLYNYRDVSVKSIIILWRNVVDTEVLDRRD